MRIHVALDGIGNFVGGALPNTDNLLVLFLLGEQAVAEVTLHQLHLASDWSMISSFSAGTGISETAIL